ncbi:MAG TPA: nucleoside recognition domain-containing protein [Ignavibacteriaceae bacterium]|nr:nucleoside recognition domain-containing protein [Ignavibacteriaceae bacterium]
MLNYVWLALLFLGIGTAITTDIINQNQNKFQNGNPLAVTMEFPGGSQIQHDKSYHANLNIKAADFSSFYKENISQDVNVNAVVTTHPGTANDVINFNVSKTDPKIWQDMATASGNSDDITGKIKIDSIISPSIAKAHIVLEDVSFLKLKDVTSAAIDYAGSAVSISLGLIGVMALWLGVMKVAEEAGLISIIARWLKPATKKLFPDVPPDHPAMGSMIMNISANMLGLGNAATPFGLKAMEELNELNPEKGVATNAMCTFLAINTAGMTLIPATAIAIRAASGSSEPAIIIGTSIFASFCATIAGITAAKILEKFPIKKGEFASWIKDKIKFITAIAVLVLIAILIIYSGIGKGITSKLGFFSPNAIRNIIQIFSTLAIPLLIVIFIGYGAIKKVRVYEKFVEGAKEGFTIAVKIIPYLVAMLVAIGIFRAGGAMQLLINFLHPLTNLIGLPAEVVPMALMRPLSGSGSLGIMAEIISVHGPDSFIGILVSTLYGSSETTFYVLAVYFGAVNIKRIRHALSAGLIADIAGVLAALFIVRLLFG